MLTPYSRSQFVTKTLISPSGEQFRVVFLVAIVDGKIQAQVVSATPLTKPEVVCLPKVSVKSPVTFTYTAPSHLVLSPFNSLFFFNSQPTRAPAFSS